MYLSPTQALRTPFVLPDLAPTSANKEQAWRRRVFRIGRFDLVLKTEPLMELLRDPKIYPLPFAPAQCVGLINRRGGLIPVFDWQAEFLVPENERSQANVLVLGEGPEALALVIGEVLHQISISGEIDFSTDGAQDLPAPISGSIEGIIQHQGKLYFRVDHEKLISHFTTN